MTKVDEFKAIDINRKVYKIIHYKSSIPVDDLDGPRGQTKEGLSAYELVDRTPVTWIAGDEFEIGNQQKTRIFKINLSKKG